VNSNFEGRIAASAHRRGLAVTSPLKQQAHALVDSLPESATWEDLAYEAELRASIDRGLADAEAGRVIPVEDLMKEFGAEE
jgi:predicted transcriptional regulator